MKKAIAKSVTYPKLSYIFFFFKLSEQDVQHVIHFENILIILFMNIHRRNFYSSKRELIL